MYEAKKPVVKFRNYGAQKMAIPFFRITRNRFNNLNV